MTKIGRTGNSSMIILNVDVMERAKLAPGDDVIVSVIDDGLLEVIRMDRVIEELNAAAADGVLVLSRVLKLCHKRGLDLNDLALENGKVVVR